MLVTRRDGACAEQARGVDEGSVDRRESGDERLHREGKAVDDRADDEALERKCERMAEQSGNAAAKSRARPEQHEKKETENGGRQNHGQGGKSFNSSEPAAAAQHDKRRERHGDGEQNRGSDGGETK